MFAGFDVCVCVCVWSIAVSGSLHRVVGDISCQLGDFFATDPTFFSGTRFHSIDVGFECQDSLPP